MSLSALLRFLSALFRRFTQVCRRLNIVDYSRKLWSLILVAMQRLHRLCSASSHETGPLPIYKSLTPPVDTNANVIVISREDETTSDASPPITSGETEIPPPREEDLLRLEEGQQGHLETNAPADGHQVDEVCPQSIHDAPEQQSQPRSHPQLKPISPWNTHLNRSGYEELSLTVLFLSLFESIEEYSIPRLR